MSRMADHMETLTGYRPETCPWRSMYDPLVADVQEAVTLKEYGPISLGDDPPALVIDALRVYLRARNATKKHDDDREMERIERERKQQMAKHRKG